MVGEPREMVGEPRVERLLAEVAILAAPEDANVLPWVQVLIARVNVYQQVVVYDFERGHVRGNGRERDGGHLHLQMERGAQVSWTPQVRSDPCAHAHELARLCEAAAATGTMQRQGAAICTRATPSNSRWRSRGGLSQQCGKRAPKEAPLRAASWSVRADVCGECHWKTAGRPPFGACSVSTVEIHPQGLPRCPRVARGRNKRCEDIIQI